MDFRTLPGDVVILIMQYLSARDLAAITQTCRFLHDLVNGHGWRAHARYNVRPSHSLRKALSIWDPYSQVKYQAITDHNWSKQHFIARPLNSKWAGKLQPALTINDSRLFVGAGHAIYTYTFTSSKPCESPGIQAEGVYLIADRFEARHDITSLASVDAGGPDSTVFVGYADGELERITLPSEKTSLDGVLWEPPVRNRWYFHGDDLIESLSSSGGYLLSLSSNGTAVFLNVATPTSGPQILHLNVRSWSAYLSTRGSYSYAAFGASSVLSLTVHSISSSGLSHTPTAILTSGGGAEEQKQSAVYGICGAPPSFPWGSSDQIIVSGWYDGPVRVHDLRSSVRARMGDSTLGPAPLTPVLSVYDPWLFEPNYSVSCGGGSSSYIAAGTARHSVVAFWDVRNPAGGWSVHAPGNDSSPVYSVILESSRLFGATQSRSFVLDFGPNVHEETYPRLKHNNFRADGLKKTHRDDIGFYVTKYSHCR
ncbi:uncharacterized protein LAESUDRAFT_641604 [Laetiporus sulphureus 93-53]|uniref:F-box domain-containing protein n=1 Tax=Laetiporus sulphureus 93-53 TaxID=1314785 RepID=A0A165HLP4_9APHY|nr:uncharacterized protein LAESUDRAFT_641604 [Laetiporus sulphureus 93-53]KZT11895.1 hypothetical protein LAESUDRAFT_641604 [Laetiporus sulphureus 93-53]